MTTTIILAKWFQTWVQTPDDSVHHGALLPADGTAVDINGRVYVQNVTDNGYWIWEWIPTGKTVTVPRALKNVMKNALCAFAGYEKAYAAWIEEKVPYEKMENARRLWKSLEKKAGRIAHEKGLI